MIDPLVAGYVGIGALIALLALGIHIGVALGLVGMVGVASIVGFEAALFTSAGSIYHKIASFDLVTVPLFIMMGYLASGGGVSKNVFEALNYWIGPVRGGLGVATVASCTAFGTVCGSSLVTAAVFANMCAPEMRRHGYDGRLAYGICASGGMIGMLIPPSILMVVYGVLAGESIGKLLIAGVVPGLLLLVLFSLAILAVAWARPNLIRKPATTAKVTWRLRLTSLAKIWQILLVGAVIFGGIFGGVFNPTEAAAVATVVLLALMLMAKFRQSPQLMKESFLETGATTAMIFLVMAGAAIFSRFLVLTGITDNLAHYIIGLNLSPLTLIWVLVAFYGVLGCFLDSISMLAITIPLFNPIIKAMGIDSIYYAVVVIMAIEGGLITPPVGLNVYGAYAVAEKDIRLEDIFVGVLPFFIMCWIAIAILIFWPGLSTFLPSIMLGS